MEKISPKQYEINLSIIGVGQGLVEWVEWVIIGFFAFLFVA
jgi:hypothetical protein